VTTTPICLRVRTKTQWRQLRPAVIARALNRAPATAGQIARHCADIAEALADSPPRIAEAIDRLDDAHDLGASSPLLALFTAALLPAAGDYVEHVGDAAPVRADTLVAVDLGAGRPLVDRAGLLCWGPGMGPDGEGRIHRWARIIGA